MMSPFEARRHVAESLMTQAEICRQTGMSQQAVFDHFKRTAEGEKTRFRKQTVQYYKRTLEGKVMGEPVTNTPTEATPAEAPETAPEPPAAPVPIIGHAQVPRNDFDRIREALQFIPVGGHDERVRVSFMLKSELGDAGRDLWDEWRNGRGDDEAESVWRSASETGPLTIGTLIFEAKAAGWRDEGQYQKQTPEQIADRQRLATQRTAEQAAKDAEQRTNTAQAAAAIWEAATETNADNPYLARKGVSPTETLREIDVDAAAAILGYSPKCNKGLLTGRLLVVPVKQGDRLSTIELIDGDGRKAALAGKGTKSGGYWSAQLLPSGDGQEPLQFFEGVATTLSGKQATGDLSIAALSSGNMLAVAKIMRERYPTRPLIFGADLVKTTGEPDHHAIEAARAVGGLLAVPDFGPNRSPDDTDFNDLARLFGKESVRNALAAAHEPGKVGVQADEGNATAGNGWPDPQPIPCSLLPVAAFDNALLPAALRDWVSDIAHRMQCPPDFTAVAAMVALSSVIGRKAGIKPKRFDDWTVLPNLWGAVVGRPAVMKSPALSEATKPLDRLAHISNELHKIAMMDYDIAQKMEGMGGKAVEAKVQKLVNQGKTGEAELLLREAADSESAKPPALRRYKVTDATVESLGEILIENPWGVLAYRDELHGLLKSLDKEGQEGARAFYLQAYDGNQGYTFDRIMRGRNLHIPAVCVAMLGGIQPGKLQSYIHDAINGGAGDDGLLQRFGMLVWPDISGEWVNIDRWPDTAAKNLAFETFQRLDAMPPGTDPETGNEAPAIYRFSTEAQEMFEAWRHEFEASLRSGEHHPAMESHLAKDRKLVPAIALVCALADGETEVSAASLARSLAWAEYLQTHAARAYAAGSRPVTEGAQALLDKIHSGKVADGFKPSDVYLKGWKYLAIPEEVHRAASLLCDLNHLRRIEKKSSEKGGRPSTCYLINPKSTWGK